jgi:hypothetical protein
MAFMHKQLTEGAGFGHDLRELREVRGVSLDTLSAQTKIHASIIEALEEERLDELKDPLYAERHVRALVTALEGRPAYYIKKYRELVEKTGGERAARVPVRAPRPWDFFVVPHAIALIGFLLVVAGTAAYLVWQGYVFQDEPRLVVTSPVDGEIFDTPSVTVRGTTDASAFVTVNGRPAVVDQGGQFSLQFDIPRGSTTLTIEARRRFGSSVTELRRITYERATIPILATSTR